MQAASALDLAVGLTFVLAGTSLWIRRPDSRSGPLTVAFGVAWFARYLLGGTGGPVGLLVSAVHVGVLVHLLATFPTGRARSGPQRVAVAGGYLVAVPLAALGPPAAFPLLAAFWAGVLGLVLVRWRRSGAVLRRALLPGTAATAVIVAGHLAGVAWPAAATVALLAWPLAVVLGSLRSRLDRAAVNDLVAELESGPPLPGRLQSAIARALHDPSVRLVYRLPAGESYVDSDGQPAATDPGPGRAATPLERDGTRIGVLVHDEALSAEPGLLDAVVAGAGMALENERLHVQARSRLLEVEASRARIVRAADAARQRVERDLQGGVQQRLNTVALILRLVAIRLAPAPEPDVADLLDEAGGELARAIDDLRELARGLYPVLLTDAGLGPALTSLAERSPVPMVIEQVPPGRFAEAVEQTCYVVVSEALDLAVRTGGVSEVTVAVTAQDGQLRVTVAHDVAGPVPASTTRDLADRVSALDGTLRVITAPGAGTTTVATLPQE